MAVKKKKNDKSEKVTVFFCPDCRGMKVKFVFELMNLFGMIPKQKCFTCGFSASQFPVLETTQAELLKKMKKQEAREKKKKAREGQVKKKQVRKKTR